MFKTNYNEKTKIWSGNRTTPTFNQNVSIGQILLQSLHRNPNKIGQINDNNGLEITNNEIHFKAISCALNLTKLNYQIGDIAGISSSNNHDLAPVIIALLTLGMPINPTDPAFKKLEIIHLWGLTKPKIIFCEFANYAIVNECLQELQLKSRIFIFGDKKVEDDAGSDWVHYVDELFVTTGQEHLFIPPNIGDGSKHIAIIIPTSGTSDLPKGATISHAAILSEHGGSYQGNEIILCFATLYWFTGWTSLISGIINDHIRIITTEQFSPELSLRLIEKYKVSLLITPPSSLALTVKSTAIKSYDLSSLKTYPCGGSSVLAVHVDEMNKYLKSGCSVLIGYGMIEIGGGVSLNFLTFLKNYSVGVLLNNTDVKIISELDGHETAQCGPNESGEIYIRKLYRFLGYYGNETETKNMIDDEGWVHSGDIGYFDAEGCLHLIDRKKDMLTYKNYHISPSEIENVISLHPAVSCVCVVGIPDDSLSELPAAVILTNKYNAIMENEIYDLVAEKLSDYNRLRGGVYFLNEFPMTPSGKILRRKITEIAIEMYNENQKLNKF